MLYWHALGENRVSFDGRFDSGVGLACARVEACTMPLVVHDFRSAAVLASATVLMIGRRPVLLTAAHVFDGGVRFGNLLAPLAEGHAFVSLSGARLTRSDSADIAVIDLSGVAGAHLILRGRQPVTVPDASVRPQLRRRRRARAATRRVLVSGYPAALAQFERGWLAARRLTVFTQVLAGTVPSARRIDRLFDYGRIASRADGSAVRTPELEGMSGAGIWTLESSGRIDGGYLRLAAVQWAYMHGRYLRGHDIAAAIRLLHE